MARARHVLAVAVLISLVVPAPAPALPFGRPTVTLSAVAPDPSDPFTYDLDALAQDPDGLVRAIEICVHETDQPACDAVSFPEGDLLERTQACLDGGSASHSLRHTFGAHGVFRATARVAAAGCDVVADSAEESATSVEIVILPGGAPLSIPCADTTRPRRSDVGVYKDRIHLASVVTASGPLSSERGDARYAIDAAVAQVNAGGGICGRRIEMRTIDDGGDASRGRQYIENLTQQDYFALVAVPSVEGLEAASRAGVITAAEMPVVGTPGLVPAEFSDPWIWPVGPAAGVHARAAVTHAHGAGARRFAVVYAGDDVLRVEAARAAEAAVAGLADATLVTSLAVPSRRTQYTAEVHEVQQRCDGRCDALFLALAPADAHSWMRGSATAGGVADIVEMGAGLFVDGLGEGCGAACRGAVAWSAYDPPIGRASDAAVRYAAAVRAHSPGADITSPLVEAAYVGTLAAMVAIGRAGGEITRTELRDLLNGEAFDVGLTGAPLSWASSRSGNRTVRGYSIRTVGDAFAGWRSEGGWVSG